MWGTTPDRGALLLAGGCAQGQKCQPCGHAGRAQCKVAPPNLQNRVESRDPRWRTMQSAGYNSGK
jgi:hypothetical protein